MVLNDRSYQLFYFWKELDHSRAPSSSSKQQQQQQQQAQSRGRGAQQFFEKRENGRCPQRDLNPRPLDFLLIEVFC
jgi:hypothetical protein